jgi:tetratricopeptide (TPR) repeat protein
MKIKILSVVFIGLCLFILGRANCFAQDEAAYKEALSRAAAQKEPSAYRAQTLKKYLDAFEETKMSEREFNQFVANKLKELMAIDFYAAWLAQIPPNPDFIKWHEILELIPIAPVAGFTKLNQWRASGSRTPYPADLPKPGAGWVTTNPGNTGPQNSSATEPNAVTPPVAAPLTAAQALITGIRQLDEKDYDAAIRSFSECIRLKPEADGCYSQRGRAHKEKQNYDSAIADFTQAIKLAPQKQQYYVNRGLAYLKMEDQGSAIADLEAALKINPNDEQVKGVLKAAREYVAAKKDYAAAEERQNNIGEDYLRQGTEQFKQKKWHEAIALYTLCINASPLNLNCYNYRGLAYGAVNELDKAIADFSAILVFKRVPEIFYQRALAYRDKKDFENALKDLTEAINLAPGDAKNYAERGVTYVYKKEIPAAVADLTQAIKINPQEARYYFFRGYAQASAGNRDSAIADYRKALQINPNLTAAKDQLQSLGVQP